MRTRGKFSGRQQFILRQLKQSLLAFLQGWAATPPFPADAHTRPVETAKKLLDRLGGNAFSMVLSGTTVDRDEAFPDPLPKEPDTHPEEPCHAGHRPDLPFVGAQLSFDFEPPAADVMRST